MRERADHAIRPGMDGQYIEVMTRVNESERIQLAAGRLRSPHEIAGHLRRIRRRVVLDDPSEHLLEPDGIPEIPIRQADLEQSVRHFRIRETELEDFLELDDRLPIVPLDVIRLADPVLGIRRERMVSVSREE